MSLPIASSTTSSDERDNFPRRYIFTDDDRIIFRSFPWIYDSNVYLEYRAYERSYFHIYQCFPIAFLYIIGILARQLKANAIGVESDSIISMVLTNSHSIVSLALIIIFGITFLFFLLLNSPQILIKFCKGCSRRVRTVQNSWIGANIEDILSVILTLIFACLLFSYDNVQNEIILLYISPIICIICLRGVSVRAICISYSIEVAFTLMTIIKYTPSGVLDFVKVLYSLFFLYIAFSFKRFSRVMFLKGKREITEETNRRSRAIQRNEERINRQQEMMVMTLQAGENKRLMEKERELLTALIGNVAHDLKTPLQSFRMELESLKRRLTVDYPPLEINHQSSDDIDDEHPLSTLISLNAATDFMSMAINRSIDFAKASGDIELVPSLETFNIPDALTMSLNVIRHIQSAMTIILNPFPLELCLNVISDKHWFSENILCLLSNAVKYSNGGTVNVIVELLEVDFEGNVTDTPHDSPVGSRDEESNVISFPSIRISIEDTGIGLSEETRKTLFQPFRQAQRMAGGTGLGLFSLSKRMEALGGSRGVSKRRDGIQGSIFWFSFPYRPDWTTHELQREIEDLSDESGLFDKGSVRSIITCEEDSSVKMFHRSLNVMLIDDSLTILNVVSRSLRKNGYNVITASNGSAGLDRLIEGHEKDEFDFVLMDLQMPVMDGIEAVTRYREFERVSGEIALQKRLPIIGMSANSDNTTKQCALKSGMDLFIPKPFILSELEPLLHQLLTKMRYGNRKSETVDVSRDSCKPETV